jgi:hypothetical protein
VLRRKKIKRKCLEGIPTTTVFLWEGLYNLSYNSRSFFKAQSKFIRIYKIYESYLYEFSISLGLIYERINWKKFHESGTLPSVHVKFIYSLQKGIEYTFFNKFFKLKKLEEANTASVSSESSEKEFSFAGTPYDWIIYSPARGLIKQLSGKKSYTLRHGYLPGPDLNDFIEDPSTLIEWLDENCCDYQGRQLWAMDIATWCGWDIKPGLEDKFIQYLEEINKPTAFVTPQNFIKS